MPVTDFFDLRDVIHEELAGVGEVRGVDEVGVAVLLAVVDLVRDVEDRVGKLFHQLVGLFVVTLVLRLLQFGDPRDLETHQLRHLVDFCRQKFLFLKFVILLLQDLFLIVLLFAEFPVLLHNDLALFGTPHLVVELLLLNRLLLQLLQDQVLTLLDLQVTLEVRLFHDHLAPSC